MRLKGSILLAGFIGPALLAEPGSAHAHVKWFAGYSYGSSNPYTWIVLSKPLFWAMLFSVASTIYLLRLAESSALVRESLWRVVSLQSALHDSLGQASRSILAGSVIFFLAGAAATGGLILTPELKTALPWVRWLQALAAVALFTRRSEPLAGLLLLVLFALGLWDYGLFHMLDYLVFLGVAQYFLLPQWPLHTRMDFLRATTALSLMWVAVEKWVYLSWTMQVVHDHPLITFGFSSDPQYVVLAGVVEFALGFGLLWRGPFSVLSALGLGLFMTLGIIEFGVADLIGHIAILGVLAALALDPIPPPPPPPMRQWVAGSTAVTFFATCAIVTVAYDGIADFLYG